MALNYRPDIDGLRAIAVLAVIFYHLEWKLFEGGFVGVDVFFVISGFLITSIIKKEYEQSGAFNYKRFYAKRIKRLFPALFSVLSFTFVLGCFFLSPQHLQRLGKTVISSVFSVSNFVFWNETDYFDTSSKMKPLLHTWSLSIEEQFYLIWPFLLIFIFKKLRREQWPWALLVLGGFSFYLNLETTREIIPFVSSFLHDWSQKHADQSATIFYLMPYRVFEFVIGALLAWIPWSVKSPLGRESLSFLGLGGVLFSVFTYTESTIFPSYNALLPCLSTALMIYAGKESAVLAFLRSRAFVKIGLMSYSLYLVHWPLIAYSNYSLLKLDFSVSFSLLLLTFVLGWINFTFVEKRLRYVQFRRLPKPRQRLAFASGLAVLFVAIFTFQGDGLAFRLGKTAVNMGSFGSAKVFHKSFHGGAGFPYYGEVNHRGAADILIVGDSHGRHYAAGVKKILAEERRLGLTIAAGTSCFHFEDFSRTTKGRNWDENCPKDFEKARKYIEDSKENSSIFLSHAWVRQLTRAKFRENEKVEIADLVNGIKKLKSMMGKRRKLFILGQVPETGGLNLYEEFSKPRFFSSVTEEDLLRKYTFSAPNKEHFEFNKKLAKEIGYLNGVVFLDPFDALCSEKGCMNIVGGELVYSDSNHLSKFGSRYVIEKFKGKILEKVRN